MVETGRDVPHLGNDKTAYLIGLFGSGRTYINELLLQNIGERAKYYRDEIRFHPGPTSMIYSGHATVRHVSRFQALPAVTGLILDAVKSGFADLIFVYRHPLDSLLTNWIWWRTYIRHNIMISGISYLYKNTEDLCADLEKEFLEFKAFAAGDPDFFGVVPGAPRGSRFLSFSEFVEETELHLQAATLSLRLEDFVIDPLKQFSRIVDVMSVDLNLSHLSVAPPKAKPFGYLSIKEKVPRFKDFVDGLNVETKKRIERIGYPGSFPAADLLAADLLVNDGGVTETTEQFPPRLKNPALAYEYIHQYLCAIPFVRGKSVLDLAPADEYGSNLLAGAGSQVIRVKIDASATTVPVSESHIFDAVTCFENRSELLAEIKRLLKPDGILIVSTRTEGLDFSAFQSLIRKYFRHTKFLGQGIFANSRVWPLETNDVQCREFMMRREGSDFDLVGGEACVPLNYIVIASDSELPGDLGGSVLVDSGNELLLEKDRLLAATREESEDRDISLSFLTASLAWRTSQVLQRDEALAVRVRQVGEFEQELGSTLKRLGTVIWQLEEIHQSTGWKFILWTRKFRQRIFGFLRK